MLLWALLHRKPTAHITHVRDNVNVLVKETYVLATTLDVLFVPVACHWHIRVFGKKITEFCMIGTLEI